MTPTAQAIAEALQAKWLIARIRFPEGLPTTAEIAAVIEPLLSEPIQPYTKAEAEAGVKAVEEALTSFQLPSGEEVEQRLLIQAIENHVTALKEKLAAIHEIITEHRQYNSVLIPIDKLQKALYSEQANP